MNGQVVDLGLNVLLVLLYGVIALGLWAVGMYVEYYSFLNAMAGDLQLGLWTGVFGLVVLAFGYLLARDRLVPMARQLVE